MKTILIILALANLLYFAFVAYLTWRARRSGHREDRRGEITIRPWSGAEFSTGWCLPAFNVTLGGGYSQRVRVQIYWVYGKLFFKLPIRTKYGEGDDAPEYGFTFTDIDSDGWQQIHWHYGGDDDYTIWDMPWTLQNHRTAYEDKFGNHLLECRQIGKKTGLRLYVRSYDEEYKALLTHCTFPYLYILKDGTAQHRYATLTVTERVWRRKWLPFTDLFSVNRRSMGFEFDQEVGERSGSWKGGVMASSYAMRPGETPVQTLRRMEAERKFN